MVERALDVEALMTFESVVSVIPNMRLWGADRGLYTYIISFDDNDPHGFVASAKLAGSLPFQGTRHDLGTFETFTEAKAACEKFGQ
jgi:hypothetical protein